MTSLHQLFVWVVSAIVSLISVNLTDTRGKAAQSDSQSWSPQSIFDHRALWRGKIICHYNREDKTYASKRIWE
jgi:hypothetical protein